MSPLSSKPDYKPTRMESSGHITTKDCDPPGLEVPSLPSSQMVKVFYYNTMISIAFWSMELRIALGLNGKKCCNQSAMSAKNL